MEIERPNQRTLTPEELAHLDKLKRLVEDALADGKVSQAEIAAIKTLIRADHKVTFEELQTIHNTTRDLLGEDGSLDYDWG